MAKYRRGMIVMLKALPEFGTPRQRARILEWEDGFGVYVAEVLKEDRTPDDEDGLTEVTEDQIEEEVM